MIERIGTNKELFVDAFQYCFGLSFPEYINFLRLKDAITLLEESDLSIEEISERVGFGTVRTFQRQFQAKYNMSPKDYRKAATR
jgi:AraC-type DNA-binding domain-containing proteins